MMWYLISTLPAALAIIAPLGTIVLREHALELRVSAACLWSYRIRHFG